MTIKKIINRTLTLEDLKGFSEQELALVYAGQIKKNRIIMFSYYDANYYDTHYYDTHYYDTHYYDTHYYERGSGYGTDEGGRKYGDSSYSDKSGC
jgi:hypothetical protein